MCIRDSSWDVRMGVKTRAEAVDELADDLDATNIKKILQEIDYDENRLRESPKSNHLVSYYTSPSPIPQAELHQHIAQKLPQSYLPTFFVPLEKIPLTPNGKIDLAALPRPDQTEKIEDEAIIAPDGPAEEAIAKIWEESLGTSNLDVTYSFFSYGGSSLAAMDVMLKICNHFSVKLALQTLFETPTIRELAIAVEEAIISELEELGDDEAIALLNPDS